MARALGRAFVRGGKPYSFRLLSPASSAHLCTEGDGFQSSRVKIFDRDLKRKQVESLRDRAAWLMRWKDEFVDSVAENLLDRLQRRVTLSLLSGGMEKLIMMDMSFDMIKVLKDTDEEFARNNLETFYVVGDEEFLPIKEKYAVLVLEWSCLLLNLQNPFGFPVQVRDAGNLLTRAGFTLPGVDVDEYTVKYDSGWFSLTEYRVIFHELVGYSLELIEHLRSMGETNALFQRSNTSYEMLESFIRSCYYLYLSSCLCRQCSLLLKVIYMTGWKEHPSQQKAKRRGSATVLFGDIQKHFGSGSC
ncbi:hypothetical protein B296_00035767 [Ensete ventricosum]|uniref:Uncharacterized protein n=1 Tax=Ensete ventricosum TaxID=4639 RepID=A0A426YEC2_ENSVE|nr:hypothetical protein B296_00035767 [Ensete ventricosum]